MFPELTENTFVGYGFSAVAATFAAILSFIGTVAVREYSTLGGAILVVVGLGILALVCINTTHWEDAVN